MTVEDIKKIVHDKISNAKIVDIYEDNDNYLINIDGDVDNSLLLNKYNNNLSGATVKFFLSGGKEGMRKIYG